MRDATDGLKLWMDSLPATLSPEENRRLGARVMAGDEAAKRAMIEGNLRLVYWVAQKFRWTGSPLMDLIQDGTLGLIRAVEKYDPERGNLSTYATAWISQAITRAAVNTGTAIRLPTQVHHAVRTVAQARKALGEDATAEQIAARTGEKVERVERLLEIESLRTVSLDQPTSDGEGGPMVALMQTDGDLAEDTSADMDARADAGTLDWALGTLKPRDRAVLRMRYGLGDEPEEMTLREIGEVLGVTVERVRQIQKRAEQALAEEFAVRNGARPSALLKAA